MSLAGDKDKEKINVLLNIDNFTGEHSGRMAPMMIFLGVSLAPWLLYLVLSVLVPLWVFLIPWVLWTARWALYILGHEPQRLKVYRDSKSNVYASANKLVHVSHEHDDGMFEYGNGKVAYIISACPRDYLNDVQFTQDLTEFMTQFDGFEFDTYLQDIVDEVKLEDNFDRLTVYSNDKRIISERIEVLTKQDEYCRNNSLAYRFNFVVKSSKFSWKKLRDKVFTIVESDYAKMFNECYVCNKEQVDGVMSRDIRIWLNLQKMLTKKYQSEQYYDSRVLFYGDDIPEEYREEPETVSLDERRVSDDKQE